jgi:hypothetical protein
MGKSFGNKIKQRISSDKDIIDISNEDIPVSETSAKFSKTIKQSVLSIKINEIDHLDFNKFIHFVKTTKSPYFSKKQAISEALQLLYVQYNYSPENSKVGL